MCFLVLVSSLALMLVFVAQPALANNKIRSNRNTHTFSNPHSKDSLKQNYSENNRDVYYVPKVQYPILNPLHLQHQNPFHHSLQSHYQIRGVNKPYNSIHLQNVPLTYAQKSTLNPVYPSNTEQSVPYNANSFNSKQTSSYNVNPSNPHQSSSYNDLLNPRKVKRNSLSGHIINDYDTNLHFNGENFYGTQRFQMSDIILDSIRYNRGIERLDFISNIIEPLKRPNNVSRAESPHYPWGKHEFGPLSNYYVTPLRTRYNVYFYEQTLAVVLEDSNRTVLNCTLLEIIPTHEQQAALRSLGQVMALVPLTLRQMVLLSSFCKSSKERQAPRPNSRRIIGETGIAPERLLLHTSTALMGIMPGTVWCGLGDRARVYHQLGERPELDSCCRAHDHCPIKLRAGDTRYGATNNGFSTLSHCLCDEAFRVCLKEASKYDDLASVVGNLFFNIVRPQCLARPSKIQGSPPYTAGGAKPASSDGRGHSPNEAIFSDNIYKPRLECAITDSQNGCRLWTKIPKSVPVKLTIIRPNFRFRRSKDI